MKSSVAALASAIFSLVLCSALPAQTTQDLPDLNLPWPFDFEVKLGTYSRDVVFNAKAADEYLGRARALYLKGYDLLKKYEGVKDSPDPFTRDPYKIFVREVHTLSFRNDFVQSRNYFTEAYAIFTEGLQFDMTLKQRPEYKQTLQRVLKGIIETSIYMKELFTANGYLDTYVSLYPEDTAFAIEYRVKIVSMLVDQQDAHEVMYFGSKSADALRSKYQLLVQQYIESRPDLDPKTKAWIIDRAAPKWSPNDYNTVTIDTNFVK